MKRSGPGPVVRRIVSISFLCLCAAVAALAASCSAGDRGGGGAGGGATERGAPELPPASAAAPIDLGAVMRQVHFAFRPDGERFSGGHSTYAVSASPADLRITPVQPGADEALRAAPFVARVSAIDRGGASLLGQGGRASVRTDGSLQIDRGAVVERLANGEEGVEQSFEIAARPAGTGDLVVRLAVSGQAFSEATSRGLHFTDPESGLGVRYGKATWIDARGVRTATPVTFEAGEIVLAVPASLIEDSAYPAVLDPVIGPEINVDAPVAPGPPPGTQDQADVAYGSGNYLVVWRDQRAFGGGDIYAARVTAAGAILDPTGILVAGTTNDEMEPAVAWSGTQWMVAWKSAFNGGSIRAARVSSAGVTLDPSGLTIGNSVYAPAVAWSGQSFVVGWVGTFPGTLTLRRLDANGMVVGSNIGLTSSVSDVKLVLYAGNVHVFFLKAGLQYQRVTPAGVVLDASPVTAFDPAGGAIPNEYAVASNAASLLIGFQYQTPAPNIVRQTRWQLLNNGAAGTVNLVDQGTNQFHIAAAATSGAFFFTWRDGNVLKGTVLANDGSLIAATSNLVPFTLSNFQFGPNELAASSDGTGFLLAYTSPGDIVGTRFTTALAKLDASPILLSPSANAELNASVAYNGTSWLVAWEDSRSLGGSDIYGARVSPNGTILDPAGIAISTATGHQREPAVASNGSGWLVAYQDGRNATDDIYATRLDASGAVQDAAGIPVSTAAGEQRHPGIASDGSGYLVSWFEDMAAPIRAARVTSAGAVQDPAGIDVATTVTGNDRAPGVAYNGTNYLVGWGASNLGSVYAARVTPGGAVLDGGNQVLQIGTLVYQTPVGVASNGADWILSWSDADARAARIAANGAILDATPITVGAANNYQWSPRAAWDGSQYVLSWSDDRAGSGALDIYGARVSPGGAAVDPAGFAIAANSEYEVWSALAGGPTGKVAVFYSRFDTSASVRAYRLRLRILDTLEAIGASCLSGAQCQSGSCADGICCDLPCSGACVACTAAKKGGGQDGACGSIPIGLDPDNECASQAQATCGTTGVCSGTGACQLHAAGLSCPASCSGSAVQTNTCDGLGACAASGAPVDCAPYACAGGACKGSCATSADCAAGAVCVGNICKALAANGAACAVGAECQSGSCADGVCCNTACAGLCVACSAAKKGSGPDGACGPIAVGMDPDDDCAVQPPSTCGTTGFCNGGGACQLWAQGLGCGGAVCNGNVVQGLICNGQGSCVNDAAGVDCAPYLCGAGTCKNPCLSTADCVAGFTCTNGVCGQVGGLGQPCANALTCQSGFCVDGVCCDSACGGKCAACTAAKKGGGADGACGPVAAGTDADNECAIQVPSTCQQNGFCDGGGACARWPAGTECAPGACDGEAQVSPSTCDGQGTCVAGASESCTEGYKCVGPSCATSCSDDSACATGYFCDLAFGACAPDSGTGGGGAGGGTGGNSTGGATGGAGTGGATGGNGTGGTGTGGTGTGGNGTGGATGGATGTTTTSGSGGEPPPGGGCGCRLEGDSPSSITGSRLLAALSLLSLLAFRRRRRA